jgi:hypothetical protein
VKAKRRQTRKGRIAEADAAVLLAAGKLFDAACEIETAEREAAEAAL